MARILVIRLSALGDVAMTVPVVASLATQYPQHEIIVLTRKNFVPLFTLIQGNITAFGADFNDRHQGLSGLWLLFQEIRKLKPDYIADLHAVLRTHFLRILFILSGVKTRNIQKGRTDKRKLTRKKNKLFVALPTTIERYQDVFNRLGLYIHAEKPLQLNISALPELVKTDKKNIGIAPFAKHQGKMYPLEFMEKVIQLLTIRENYRVILFGGGANEKIILDKWADKFRDTISVAGNFTLSEEMALMSQLDIMLSMDSANMHLASLVEIPVISVWGATHSFAGFGGWQQSDDYKVELDMECRPCSVYGNKPCYRGDNACMNKISPEMIVEKLMKYLK